MMSKILHYSKNMLAQHQLCFLHIPKTAGTTFTELLFSLFEPEQVIAIHSKYISGMEEFPFDINDYDCFSGHFTFEINKLMRRKPLFLTFLRDPISRSISQFYEYRRIDLDSPYIKKLPDYESYQNINSITLDDFLKIPSLINNVNNLQTRLLGLSIESPVSAISDTPLYDRGDRHVSLQLAKERLEKFFFLGIQENFEKSMQIFAYQFGTLPVDDLPFLNLTTKKKSLDEFSQAALDQLYELNRLDIELYEFGFRLFEARYRKMEGEMRRSYPMEDLTTRELLELLYWDRKEERRNLLYHLERAFPQDGWHPVEQVENEQWMWSGPETTSTIDLPIDRSENLQIRLLIKYYIEPDVLDSLLVSCDNQPLILNRERIPDGQLFSGTVPANPARKPAMSRFSFQVCRTAYPPGLTAEIPGARLLGIALSWIEISPLI